MSKVEYLDPEIAGEGLRADHAGIGEDYQPVYEPPHIPTYQGLNSIKHLFPQFSNRPYRHQAFPAWIYHETEAARLISNPMEASQFGLKWLPAPHFKWEVTGKWHPQPVQKPKAVASGTGKNVMEGNRSNAQQSGEMVAAVVAAVMANMKTMQGAPATGAAPAAAIDPDYVEFQAFKAWKAAQMQAVDAPAGHLVGAENALAADVSPEAEKKQLLEIAGERGIEIAPDATNDAIKALLDAAGEPEDGNAA